VHLVLSAIVAAIVGTIIFLLWYPGFHRDLVGGRELFMLVASVDVVLGPLLTLAIFNPSKPRKELVRDLSMVGIIQLSALVYGLHTVYLARPAWLVFEIDRFRVVSVADIDTDSLSEAKPHLRDLPLTGPGLISAKMPQEDRAYQKAFELSFRGVDLGMQPAAWLDYDGAARTAALRKATTARALMHRFEGRPEQTLIMDAVRDTGKPINELFALPLVGREKAWTILIDSTGEPVGHIAIDIF
jgi:hypothetical protein